MKNEAFVKWDTPCSDLRRLYFVSLVDDIQNRRLIFSVTDGEIVYKFSFEHHTLGPYQVFDEAFANYSISDSIPGRTYVVQDSIWPMKFSAGSLGLVFPDGLTHFGICADDSCLEALATSAPNISTHAR